jgi:hypothetical protein
MRAIADALYELYFWCSIGLYVLGLWLCRRHTHCLCCGEPINPDTHDGICQDCGAW